MRRIVLRVLASALVLFLLVGTTSVVHSESPRENWQLRLVFDYDTEGSGGHRLPGCDGRPERWVRGRPYPVLLWVTPAAHPHELLWAGFLRGDRPTGNLVLFAPPPYEVNVYLGFSPYRLCPCERSTLLVTQRNFDRNHFYLREGSGRYFSHTWLVWRDPS